MDDQFGASLAITLNTLVVGAPNTKGGGAAWIFNLADDQAPPIKLIPPNLASEDAFGNTVHMLSLSGPITALTVAADGEVDTSDSDGLVSGAVERFPTGLYLRQTPLTVPSADLAAFAKDTAGDVAANPLGLRSARLRCRCCGQCHGRCWHGDDHPYR